MKYFIACGDQEVEVEIHEQEGQRFVRVNGEPFELSYTEIDALGQVAVQRHGETYALSMEGNTEKVRVTLAGHVYGLALEDERERAAHVAEKAVDKGKGPLRAVMPGFVAELLVAEGDQVEEGTPLLLLEAMKMQNEITAPCSGIVKTVAVAAGEAVQAGDVLLTIQ
jgi:biotin carboxyl carrier protein